jgi:hypothetical protein
VSGLAGTVRFAWPDDGTLSEGTGHVTHVAVGEDGRPGLIVRWSGPLGTRDSYVAHAEWLARDGIPLTAFGVSVEAVGAAWSGDVREVGAWHAEAPAGSGWWDGKSPRRRAA